MSSPFDLELLLPESRRHTYDVKLVHLLKIGHVRAIVAGKDFNSDSSHASVGLSDIIQAIFTRPDESKNPGRETLRAFAKDLYTRFEKSPSVLEIKPPKPSDDLTSSCSLFSSKEGLALRALGGCIDLRIALSQPLRREYGGLIDAPEQFRLIFDGRLFLAWCDMAELQLKNSLGQAAREFLRATITTDKATPGWPVPLRPDIYLVAVERQDHQKLTATDIMPFRAGKNDLVVLYPPTISVRNMVELVRSDLWRPLQCFYDARSTCWLIDDRLDSIGELNDELNGYLASLFERSSFSAMFSGIPRHIRRVLSHIHLQLQVLSEGEIKLREAMKMLTMTIDGSTVLKPARDYLEDEAGSHDSIDKDTQLRLMDYAGSEATNVSVLQATVWAAIIGAVVGALMTLLASHWPGGGASASQGMIERVARYFGLS
jgi:hypothetical protein